MKRIKKYIKKRGREVTVPQVIKQLVASWSFYYTQLFFINCIKLNWEFSFLYSQQNY